MKKYQLNYATVVILIVSINMSCKKFEQKNADIYHPVTTPSNPVSDAARLCGNIKGTMLRGKTYTIGCDVIVQAGDTLLIQNDVHINVTSAAAGILVNGTLLSIGTKDKPNYITVPTLVKTDVLGANPNSDPAFKGSWRGIVGGVNCPLIVLKWTHVEFGGAAAGNLIGPAMGIATNKNTFDLYFQNQKGTLIVEDSWFYGSVDDPIRVLGGKLAIFRNTFEKCGYTSGEAINIKGGTVGDFAYNLCVGMATNGPKSSNNGGTAIQTNMRFYNNTIVNCGYRRAQTGRGGSINYEEGSAGKFYNNLMVNCRYGPRVVISPPADTTNLQYGNNFQYGDSVALTNQFYPVGFITKPQVTDIPLPRSFLPANYQLGLVYDGTPIVGKNDPMFINGPVPLPSKRNLRDVSFAGSYNFTLKQGSPCIGKGYTGFKPTGNVPVDPIYGASELTQPGKDIGAFQSDGSGNHH